MSVLFEIRDFSFSYPGGVPALKNVSLQIEKGGFFLLCGPSGSGKSTLLRQLKPILAPHGEGSGQILFQGRSIRALDRREQCERIGFVFQSPEDQIVTDKVWHEMSFGLESLGRDPAFIRRRVAETVSFFGIESWFSRDVFQLSGGQKQLLNLAAVMAMDPEVLILDEPTGQLDPVSASDFLAALGRLNREYGITVILSEHRLEEAMPLATSAAVLDGGRLLCCGPPRHVGESLRQSCHPMFAAMPVPMRVWAAVDSGLPCPLTVREGRDWLAEFAACHPLGEVPPAASRDYPQGLSLEAKGIWHSYEKDGPDVLKDFSLSVQKGEFLALLGGNGTGKTTALKLMAGTLRPYRGKVESRGKTLLLPQSPQTLFIKKTLREDLLEAAPEGESFSRLTALCRLGNLLDRHPFDLSAGEMERAALCKLLLLQPDVLLLDEPTRGVDAGFKQIFGEIVEEFLSRGGTVIMASHDMEFCAEHAHRCALLFDGAVVAGGSPRNFFSGGGFYTTSANRMARPLLPQAVTAADVAAACGGSLPPAAKPPKPLETTQTPSAPGKTENSLTSPGKRPLSKRAALCIAVLLLLVPATVLAGAFFPGGKKYTLVSFLVLLECMLPFFLAFESRRPKAGELVTVAALCALGVAGRAAFYFLPQCKPVLAVAAVSGAAFGGEAGFLVGAVSMLVSNLFYGQGPWTPWQMFAMGLCGFCGGLLFKKGRLPRNRWLLGIYGFLAAVVLYGVPMNLSSALTWNGEPTLGVLLGYLASGFPYDCIHGAASFIFLWLGGAPLLEKLERLKTKYGLS